MSDREEAEESWAAAGGDERDRKNLLALSAALHSFYFSLLVRWLGA